MRDANDGHGLVVSGAIGSEVEASFQHNQPERIEDEQGEREEANADDENSDDSDLSSQSWIYARKRGQVKCSEEDVEERGKFQPKRFEVPKILRQAFVT